MVTPQLLADVAGELLSEPAGRDTLEGSDQPGDRHLRRVVNEEVHVVALAVELHQFGFEVGADGPHDLFAAREDLIRERAAPVLGREDQVGMEGMDDRTTPADIGVWLPSS